MFLRWPQGGPTPYGYILQAVGSPWNYSAELYLFHFYVRHSNSTSRNKRTVKKKKKEPTRYRPSGRTFALGPPCGPPAVALRAPCVCLENPMALYSSWYFSSTQQLHTVFTIPNSQQTSTILLQPSLFQMLRNLYLK